MCNMPATESEQDVLSPKKSGVLRSWPKDPLSEKAAGITLIDPGLTLVGAKDASIPGLCSRCRSGRDPQRSSSNFPDLFCSEECEQEFIHTAVASVTLEDCIRMQRRLDNLLTFAERTHV
jgi:hypothetical protein